MMTYEKKVEYIKLLQQLEASFIPIAETNDAGADRYGGRIGAEAYVCKAGKRALLVIKPKARIDDHGDGLDYDEADVERDDFEGEEFFDGRPQFIYCGIHEFDWDTLTSAAISELESVCDFVDFWKHPSPKLAAGRDVVRILSEIVDMQYSPKTDRQFGPPSKILKAWLSKGLDYSLSPGFGYLDRKLFLFDGKVIRAGMFSVGWRGDQALASALIWLVRTECIDISAYKYLPFPESLRATMRAQAQTALQQQISSAEAALSKAEAAVRHWEAELARKRQELKELRQPLDPKNLSGPT